MSSHLRTENSCLGKKTYFKRNIKLHAYQVTGYIKYMQFVIGIHHWRISPQGPLFYKSDANLNPYDGKLFF